MNNNHDNGNMITTVTPKTSGVDNRILIMHRVDREQLGQLTALIEHSAVLLDYIDPFDLLGRVKPTSWVGLSPTSPTPLLDTVLTSK